MIELWKGVGKFDILKNLIFGFGGMRSPKKVNGSLNFDSLSNLFKKELHLIRLHLTRLHLTRLQLA